MAGGVSFRYLSLLISIQIESRLAATILKNVFVFRLSSDIFSFQNTSSYPVLQINFISDFFIFYTKKYKSETLKKFLYSRKLKKNTSSIVKKKLHKKSDLKQTFD